MVMILSRIIEKLKLITRKVIQARCETMGKQ